MSNVEIGDCLKPQVTIDRDGIKVSKEIADKTVWDELAVENPTHAVISAKDEDAAAQKSLEQITDIKQFLKPEHVLLDLGTGYGRVAKYLLPKMSLKGYIGVDSSYQMLSLFKKRYSETKSEQNTPVLLVNADIHTIPLQDKSADVAIVCAVFLHNHKSIVCRSIEEINRVLKPGGKVLVYSSFPRSATFMGIQGYSYQLILNLLGKPFKNGPVRYYRRSEIVHLFAGFKELDLYPVGYSVLPKTIIFLPKPLEILWRVGIANPINFFLEKITPTFLKPYLAVHFDVVATK